MEVRFGYDGIVFASAVDASEVFEAELSEEDAKEA